MAVADVFDALTTSRPYKKSYTTDESIKMIEKEVGSHFDPKVFEAFINGMDEILLIGPQLEKTVINLHADSADECGFFI